MTQTAVRTDPLSPELNLLINDYPRDVWDAHPNFARSTQNWLGAHQAFRQLSNICVSKTERIFDKDMGAEHYGHILGRDEDSLVRNLHGQHKWEDRQFFPELASADPRFETGPDLLEKDHEVLDETLDRFTRASNRYLKLLGLDPTSAEQELGDIHIAGCQIRSLLSRHLQDEEDLIYSPYCPIKMNTVVMNEPDLKILRELQRDSDQSLDQISEQVCLSRNAVWKRIRTMEHNGVIASRVAILDAAAFDLNLTVFIQLKTASHSKDWIKRLECKCKLLPQVQGAYRMSGDLDYLLRAVVRAIQDYDRIYQELIERLEPSDVSASFVMEKIVDHTRLPI